MHTSIILSVFSLSLYAVSAFQPSSLFSRNTVSGGGWALRATSCAPTFQLCGHNDMCCPANTDCINSGTGNHCCAPGTICHDLIVASPQCADDSWSLWNSTTTKSGQGYFCCLPGQVGTNTGSCVAAGSNVVQTLSASLLSSATGVAQTSASAVLSISSAAATAKTTPGTSPTTYTTSGAAPVQTSIPGKSDAAPSRVLEQLVCFGVAVGIGAFLI